MGGDVIAGTLPSVKYAGRAPDGHVLLRVFLGGALRDLLGIGEAPLWTRVARYP
jgi:hypothetical protein